MTIKFLSEPIQGVKRLIIGEGTVANEICNIDWSKTSLGPLNQWPDDLIIIINVILPMPLPTTILWSQDLYLFYND